VKFGSSFLWLVMLPALAACKSESGVFIYHGKPVVAAPESEPEKPVLMDQGQQQQQRILADILYEAKAAYADNRLMLPAGRNAYEAYQQVLRLDPENAVALEGIQEIVLRYLTMADAAIRQAAYDNAEQYIARAERVNPGRPELAGLKAQLAAARKTQINMHELNPSALSARSPKLMNELGEIARQLQASGGTFLIRARTDEEGRWIYKTMSEAVGGRRLHGNIETAATPGIVISAANGDPATHAKRE
jgi:tetratricopeptide (TPR) repeat protein